MKKKIKKIWAWSLFLGGSYLALVVGVWGSIGSNYSGFIFEIIPLNPFIALVVRAVVIYFLGCSLALYGLDKVRKIAEQPA